MIIIIRNLYVSKLIFNKKKKKNKQRIKFIKNIHKNTNVTLFTRNDKTTTSFFIIIIIVCFFR